MIVPKTAAGSGMYNVMGEHVAKKWVGSESYPTPLVREHIGFQIADAQSYDLSNEVA